jgi:O-antigen/teichoic acid export membrane protein
VANIRAVLLPRRFNCCTADILIRSLLARRRDGRSDPERAAGAGTIRRALENVGWLLAGKGVGAVLSLIYLGLATRTLGPENFGQFVLILGTSQAISAFVGFQTWQMVVRYGVDHLLAGRMPELRRLTNFSVALDIASASCGCLLATGGVLLLGPHMGWSDDLQLQGLLFCYVTLLTIRSTAVGLLRLHDRYALGAAADTMTPVVRFLGALAAVLVEPTVTGFLFAWAAAEVASCLFFWISARLFAGYRFTWPFRPSMLKAPAENAGLWHFIWVTNIGSTLSAGGKQLAVILVGVVAGPVAAGSYRLAHQLGQALAKIAELLSRGLFSELAHAHSQHGRVRLALLVRQAALLSLGIAAVIITLLLLLGKPALGWVAGPEYVAAYPLLLLLGTAAALDIGGVSFEPALLTTGRPGLVLKLRLASTLTLAALLALLLPPFGASGAGIAMLVSSAVGLLLFGWAAWRVVHDGADTPDLEQTR